MSQAVTRTREVVRVEEVEETLWECANCGCLFDPDEVVPWEPPEGDEVPLCRHCSEIVLGYEGEAGMEGGGDDGASARPVSPLASVMTFVFSIGVLVFVLDSMVKLAGGISADPGAGPEAASMAVNTMLEILPLFVLLLMIVAVGGAVGPRGIR